MSVLTRVHSAATEPMDLTARLREDGEIVTEPRLLPGLNAVAASLSGKLCSASTPGHLALRRVPDPKLRARILAELGQTAAPAARPALVTAMTQVTVDENGRQS